MGQDRTTFIHPTAVVDSPSSIGVGTRIWHFSHVMAGATIGAACNIGQNVVVARGCVIGNNVKIQNNVSVYTGVTVEDDVFLGPSVVFTNVINPRAYIERKNEYRPTLVRRGASVGANSTIVCGVTLGEYCFVGAGAVVTRDVPAFATVYGNPARIRGYTCWCGVPLLADEPVNGIAAYHCPQCSRRYRLSGGVLAAADAS